MQSARGTMLIRNGQIVDGTGAAPILNGAVVVEDGKITFVGREDAAPLLSRDATVIDARGGTIMPGLVEAHFHPTYFNVAALEDLDIKYPVEYVTLLAAGNAKLALEPKTCPSSASTYTPATLARRATRRVASTLAR